MAYKFSKGNRGLGDITFEDDADTGIDFESDTIKLETNGQERVVVTNTNTLFNTPIRTTSIEYTDGDDAITIDDGGHIKLHSGIKYARGVLVSSAASPAEVGGWIKFATLNVPGTSNVDTAASSFLVTFAGQESSNNRTLDGIFLVHAKFTVNTDGTGDGAGNYYETEGTFITCEPLNANNLSAAGATDFAPATDLLMIAENTDSTPVVDLYMKANAKGKHCFVTHLGGTGQTGTFDTDAGWTINTGEGWVTNEPAAPGGSVKISGTYVSKIFSDLTVGGLVYDAPADPTVTFSENGTEKATIGVNSSDNIVVENKSTNKHIVFKVNDQGVVREGLRLDGAVPEVVVNQASDSLVDFRVESDNNTHMLFVDGSQDKIGIGLNNPSHMLDINGDIRIRGNDIRDNSSNKAISFDGSANTEIVNSLIVGGGVYKKLRDVNSTGNILQTDYVIRLIQNSAITLTLPSRNNNQGQIIILKDALGNANSNNVTVQAATGDTIDGSSSYTISHNKEGVTLMCDGINGWMILSRVRP